MNTFIILLAVLLGGTLIGFLMIADSAKALPPKAPRTDADGIHWGWWVFWGLVFLPSLIVVAILHNGRKTRAAIREAAAQ